MSSLEGSCHCGAIALVVPRAPTELTSCNCSWCRRLGSLWMYFAPAEVTITGRTDTYASGDKMIIQHRCATCGCLTHWSSVDPTYERMGVNARMFAPSVIDHARIRRLDGADTWKFFDD